VLRGEIIGDGEQAGAEQAADCDHAKALTDAFGTASFPVCAAVHGAIILKRQRACAKLRAAGLKDCSRNRADENQ
jgi:hypothetical protein